MSLIPVSFTERPKLSPITGLGITQDNPIHIDSIDAGRLEIVINSSNLGSYIEIFLTIEFIIDIYCRDISASIKWKGYTWCNCCGNNWSMVHTLQLFFYYSARNFGEYGGLCMCVEHSTRKGKLHSH